MILAKLFILGQERGLHWCETDYYRQLRPNGDPASEVMGGQITMCFSSEFEDDIILDWMTKESEDQSGNEEDKMEEGKLCFYDESFDQPPSKTWKFNDAQLVFYEEVFSSENAESMKTVITISPAIQDYGVEIIKPWNINWIPPSEVEPYQPMEYQEPEIVACHYTDANGSKNVNLTIGDEVYLVVETKELVGKQIDIDLKDAKHDFLYNGARLENDTLKGFKITSNEQRIKLEIASPHQQLINL